MNTIYTTHYHIRCSSADARRRAFWNRVADGVLCAASTMGVITALFFLLTL